MGVKLSMVIAFVFLIATVSIATADATQKNVDYANENAISESILLLECPGEKWSREQQQEGLKLRNEFKILQNDTIKYNTIHEKELPE